MVAGRVSVVASDFLISGGRAASAAAELFPTRRVGCAVKSRAELVEQIRVTLLHEVGHLRGEDDYELAARGLE